MAKRISTGQSNTLLNYFQSPKSSKEVKQIDCDKSEVISSGLCNIFVKIRFKYYYNKLGKENGSPVAVRKRKKISIIDSESEDENMPINPISKKKKNVMKRSASDSDESSDSVSKPKEKKSSLKQFSFENSSETCSNTSNESKKSAPVVNDINTSWLHNRLDFLQPDKICDINKKRPGDADYDPRTLYVPQSFLDKQTPAMRQWWILKSNHMDSVLFFKVGKFYELYHMDAVVGVTQLGFSYMKVHVI